MVGREAATAEPDAVLGIVIICVWTGSVADRVGGEVPVGENVGTVERAPADGSMLSAVESGRVAVRLGQAGAL